LTFQTFGARKYLAMQSTLGIQVNFPSASNVALGALLAFIWSYSCLAFSGYLKTTKHFPTGYTRKIFHVLIFMSAVIVHAFGGFIAVCVFGSMVSIAVGMALVRGPGNPLYEAIAREKDGAYRTYYVVIPYFATLLGGLASNLVFGPLAVIGYLVGGLGDAAGEPAGTRWGKHQFRTANNDQMLISKTFEGSAAVLASTIIALVIGVAISPDLHFDSRAAIALPFIGLVCTLVEAFSPRGWDNVPMQFVPTVLAAVLLTK
jgi:phytol kinase